jgi:hypothetical protein
MSHQFPLCQQVPPRLPEANSVFELGLWSIILTGVGEDPAISRGNVRMSLLLYLLMMSIINDWLPNRNVAEDGRDITALLE